MARGLLRKHWKNKPRVIRPDITAHGHVCCDVLFLYSQWAFGRITQDPGRIVGSGDPFFLKNLLLLPRKFGVSRGRRARGGGRDFLGLDPRDTRSNRGWHGFNRQVDASEVRMEWTARERIRNKTTPPCCSINMGSLSSFLRAPSGPTARGYIRNETAPPCCSINMGSLSPFFRAPSGPPNPVPQRPLPRPLGRNSPSHKQFCAPDGVSFGWDGKRVTLIVIIM